MKNALYKLIIIIINLGHLVLTIWRFVFYFRRQFRTVLDAFVKLQNIAEVIDEMLPKFTSKW